MLKIAFQSLRSNFSGKGARRGLGGREGKELGEGYHQTLIVGVLLFAVLHRADESQPARNSCPRLPHFVDSRFGLYHVAVVLSSLRSPALHKFDP